MCPELKKTLMERLAEYKTIKIQDESQIKLKKKLLQQKKSISDEIRKVVTKPENIIPFLVPGRMIRVKTEQDDWGWGILSSFSRQRVSAKNK
jgi:ATP-dependent RNA helicase DOB1